MSENSIVTGVENKVWNSTESRALKLLGSGSGPAITAMAVGVSESRISQLLSDPQFAAEVSELRFRNLQKHNELDDKYDSMESRLLAQLEDLLPLMMRPMEILKAIAVINGAKRRGQSSPESTAGVGNQVVTLTMPTLIMQNFTTNINNQVIKAGNQTLETMQSSSLLAAAKTRAGERNEQIRNSTGNNDSVSTISREELLSNSRK